MYFVPPGETLEVWRVQVRNDRDVRADISLFSSIEFCLWDAQDDATNFQRNFSTGEVEVLDSVIYHKTEYRERRNHFAYFACSELLAGFDTQRDTFLGPYRGWDTPEAVERGECFQLRRSRLGADRIAPRAALTQAGTRRARSSLSSATQRIPLTRSSTPLKAKIINKSQVQPVFEHGSRSLQRRCRTRGAARAPGTRYLSVLRVSGRPSEDTNRMVNIWNPYQCMTTFNLSRSMSSFRIGHRSRHGIS